MDMKSFIEKAEKKAGKQVELARILGISDAYIRAAKRGARGLPVDICILLADFINEDPLKVIAASSLVTEKDEKKRKIFESCFSRAATVTVTAFLLSALSIMSPSTANASPASSSSSTICIMLNKKNKRINLRRKSNMLEKFFHQLLGSFRLTHS